MPLKSVFKGKGKGKQVDNRFVNDKARKNFEGTLRRRDKGIIPERSLTAFQAEAWARGRGWDTFMKEPTHLAVEPIVREFYGNFPECEEGTVFVRGVEVSVTAEVINQFYKIPPIFQKHYENWKTAHRDEEDILRILAKPGTQWDVSRKGRKNLKGASLLPVARLWQYFVFARLAPETHYSTVSYDKAGLIYAIATRQPLDVGDIILNNIKSAAQPGRGSFPFPHLITDLCLRAGVKKSDDDKPFHLGPVLDTAFYHKYLDPTSDAPARSNSKRQRTSQGTTSSSSSSGNTKGMLQKIMKKLERMECRQNWLAEQTQMMHEMQRSCFSQLQVDNSQFQWADWDSEEWMGSEPEDEETVDEEAKE